MSELVQWSDPQSMASLSDRYKLNTQSRARAENTTGSYASDWGQWMQFLEDSGIPEPDSTDAAVVAIGIFLERRQHLKPATLHRNLAGIRRGMIDRDQPWPNDPKSLQAFRDHILDLSRHHTGGLNQATPASEGLIRQVSAAADNTPKGRRDRAIMVLGFLSGMRRDNISRLDLADARFDSEGVALHQRRSKTDQGGIGKRIFIPLTRHPETCAARTLQAWLKDRGDEPGPLFWSMRNHLRLDGSTIYRVVRALTAATGDPARYSPHSLRSGLITSASRRGATPHQIKQQSGHASIEMVERYTRDARGYEDNIVNLLESL